jgi:predicted ATPase
MLVLVSSRPEYRHTWGSKTYYTQLSLEPLSAASASELVDALLGDDPRLAATRRLLVDRAEGNPFFLEESVRTLVETGALVGTPGAYRSVEPFDRTRVPATVQAVLAARMDRLPREEQQLLQTASVIGKDVPRALLRAIAEVGDEALDRCLTRLLAGEFLYESPVVPAVEYAFKHALTQEVAYGSLLPHERTRLHAKVVEAVERLLGDRVGEQAEVLAYHALRGEVWNRAVDYLREAGEKAFARAALREAVSHLTKGLEVAATLPDTEERRTRELGLLITLGPVLINTKGPRTRDVAETYARALELCARLPESPLHFAALWGSWRISPNFHTKHELAAKLLALAEGLGDPGLRLQAHHCLWATSFHLAQHQACCEHVEEGLRVYEAGDYRSHAAIYGGHDPKACGLAERAFALWLFGFPDRALAASRAAMAWARQLAHAGTLVHALDMSLLLHRYRRDAPAVQAQAEELIRYSEDQAFSVHKAKGTVFLGWALAELGEPEVGIERMRQGLEAQQAISTREDFPVLFDMLGAAYAAVGRAPQGLEVVDQALAETERSGLSYWTAELHRRRGEVLLALSPEHEAEAEARFRQALEVARAQQARSLELRAAMSLARLERGRGRAEAAHALLAPVHAWFTEGFDTADLKDARVLLEALAPSATPRRGHPGSE